METDSYGTRREKDRATTFPSKDSRHIVRRFPVGMAPEGNSKELLSRPPVYRTSTSPVRKSPPYNRTPVPVLNGSTYVPH